MTWLGAWLYAHLGISGTGPWYGFLSGAGSILLPPLITLAGVAALWAWHNQCHVTGCHWPARRVTAAHCGGHPP